MKSIDISPLKNNDEEIAGLVSVANEKIKGIWDDSIRDSFITYCNELKDYSTAVHEIRNQIESVKGEIEKLEIDILIDEVDKICGEAQVI